MLKNGTWQGVKREKVSDLLFVFNYVAVNYSISREEVVFYFLLTEYHA